MSKPTSKRGMLRISHTSSDGADVDTALPIAALNGGPQLTGSQATTNNPRRLSLSAFRGLAERLTHRWAEWVLGVIIVSASLLSLFWVFTVPILQNPDEDAHVDYAFSIYSAGRLLNSRRPPSGWNVHERAGTLNQATRWHITHQYTLYLSDSTDFQRLKFHAEEKVSPDYGTVVYYQRLDRNAPHSPADVPDLQAQDNPWVITLVTGYPFGYYALEAVWLWIIAKFTGSVVSLFFGARILSVVLFACSLVVNYATTRELRLGKARALALTFIVAFFPLTTFVSSSIQPDNLAFLLMLLCVYLSLLIHRGSHYWLLTLLGTALGILLVTKYQFYLFTFVSILGTLASEYLFKRRSGRAMLRGLSILLLPSALFFG